MSTPQSNYTWEFRKGNHAIPERWFGYNGEAVIACVFKTKDDRGWVVNINSKAMNNPEVHREIEAAKEAAIAMYEGQRNINNTHE